MDGSHELRYQSLFNPGRALSFPCDAEGHVLMDALGDRALANYLYVRVVVGREYAMPQVRIAPSD
jgi:hypothetical protein